MRRPAFLITGGRPTPQEEQWLREGAKRERAERERPDLSWEERKRQERKAMHDEAEAAKAEADALARMNPAQLAAHYAREATESQRLIAATRWDDGQNRFSTDYGRIPEGQLLIRDEIRREDAQKANRDREKAEERAGIPKAQAKWAKARDAIEARRRASEDQAKAAHAEALAAIRDNTQRELDELGEMPVLQEAVR